MIRIHLAKRRSHLLLTNKGNRGNRDLLGRLAALIRRRRSRRKTVFVLVVFLVVGSPRRYTQKNYPHARENRHASHLFPLSGPATRPYSGGCPLSTVPGN